MLQLRLKLKRLKVRDGQLARLNPAVSEPVALNIAVSKCFLLSIIICNNANIFTFQVKQLEKRILR